MEGDDQIQVRRSHMVGQERSELEVKVETRSTKGILNESRLVLDTGAKDSRITGIALTDGASEALLNKVIIKDGQVIAKEWDVNPGSRPGTLPGVDRQNSGSTPPEAGSAAGGQEAEEAAAKVFASQEREDQKYQNTAAASEEMAQTEESCEMPDGSKWAWIDQSSDLNAVVETSEEASEESQAAAPRRPTKRSQASHERLRYAMSGTEPVDVWFNGTERQTSRDLTESEEKLLKDVKSEEVGRLGCAWHVHAVPTR